MGGGGGGGEKGRPGVIKGWGRGRVFIECEREIERHLYLSVEFSVGTILFPPSNLGLRGWGGGTRESNFHQEM